jgi:hypothetical protein
MTKEEIEQLISIRTALITSHNKCKDYKQNKNAIMREIDHVEVLEKSIKSLDKVLGNHVKFS